MKWALAWQSKIDFSDLEIESFDIPLVVKTDRIACHAIQPSGKTTWFRAGHLTQLVNNDFGSNQTLKTIVCTKAIRFEPQELVFGDDRLPYFLRFTPRSWVMSLTLKIYLPDPIRYGIL
jgi:hypothetical protein